jgi:hypothetical protein
MYSYQKCPLNPREWQKTSKIPPLAVNNGKTVRLRWLMHK